MSVEYGIALGFVIYGIILIVVASVYYLLERKKG
jgi:hypothetical protein